MGKWRVQIIAIQDLWFLTRLGGGPILVVALTTWRVDYLARKEHGIPADRWWRWHCEYLAMQEAVYPSTGDCFAMWQKVQASCQWLTGGKPWHKNSAFRSVGESLPITRTRTGPYGVWCLMCSTQTEITNVPQIQEWQFYWNFQVHAESTFLVHYGMPVVKVCGLLGDRTYVCLGHVKSGGLQCEWVDSQRLPWWEALRGFRSKSVTNMNENQQGRVHVFAVAPWLVQAETALLDVPATARYFQENLG